MSISQEVSKTLFGAVGLSLLTVGTPKPAIAQTLSLDDLRLTAADTTETTSTEALLVERTFEIEQQPVSAMAHEPHALSPYARSLQPEQKLTQRDIKPAKTLVPSAPVIAVPTADVQPITEAAALRYSTAYATGEASSQDAIAEEISIGLGSELTHTVPETLVEEPLELAQARRRTRGTALGSDYIGIGADIGYTDDFGFAAISKFSFSRRFAVRPSIVIGDDFSVLVPITYDFSQYSRDIGGFPVRPYAGVGASYTNSDNDEDDNNTTVFDNDDGDDSEINLLLSAGVDVPISRRFTLNGQVNWGVLNESQFGVTVGVGYNLGNLFSQ